MNHPHKELFFSVIETALVDDKIWAALKEDASAVFTSAGMVVPADSKDEFNKHLFDQLRIMKLATQAGNKTQNAGSALIRNLPSAGCAACKVAAWAIAATLSGLTALGLTALTATSSVVVGLAAFAGVSGASALAFITGATMAAASGISAIASAICKWMGACP